MKSVAVGDRVRVAIDDPNTYARGCATCLEGKAGVVEEISRRVRGVRQTVTEATSMGDGFVRALVRFDTPAKAWHTHQSPTEAFWFPLTDLAADTATAGAAARCG